MTNFDKNKLYNFQVFETSKAGHKLTEIKSFEKHDTTVIINIFPEQNFQKITGFGGSFTQASAHILNQLGDSNRSSIIEAYFGDSGAKYSLARTHINSCDFSLYNYSLASVPNDYNLDHFSVEIDKSFIIPFIKSAKEVSTSGFKIISSPWTAPPWMKDNNDWCGGKLLVEYYQVWALFFEKYLTAYKNEGIDIWGVTVENEPLGNDNNWESMLFSPEEINTFVKNYLYPRLHMSHPEVKILGYDQNRDEQLYNWVDKMYDHEDTAKCYDGIAIHWYESTYEYFPDALQYSHQKAPSKYIIQTESCIDAQVPVWKNDAWYWSIGATDWGWTWAPEEKKHLHPKYVPVFRYARDIIGCLNNWVDGWIDWNMVLDRQGGPNWAQNWCIAPIIADVDIDEYYITPLYYIMAHFSRFIRPEATRIGFEIDSNELMTTVVKNPDDTYVVIVFNPTFYTNNIQINLEEHRYCLAIDKYAIQTITFSQLPNLVT